MNWYKVKNILLFILITMNIFVISALTVKRITTENIPPVVSAAGMLALNNSGITCDSSLIPDKYLSAPRLEAAFPSPMGLSLRFFGSQLAFQSDNEGLTAQNEKGILVVKDEFFSYKTENGACEFGEKRLRRALEDAGFNMSKGLYSEKYNTFVFYYDNRPLFDMYIYAALDKNGELCVAEGKWPDRVRPLGSETGLSVISHLPEAGNEFGAGGTIESIRFGYSLLKESDSGGSTFIPAWKVKMKDGRSKVFR